MLKVVRDVAMSGDDDPRSVTDREDVAAIAAAGDRDHAIELTAGHIVDVVARYHQVHEVIRGALGHDPRMPLWTESVSVGSALATCSSVWVPRLGPGIGQ